MKYTPDLVESLEPNQIFVFGSNEGGRHGAGAARTASLKFGAIYGQSEGMQGNSYGIPTMDKNFRRLPLRKINEYICNFIDYAADHPTQEFLVTKVGCGLAGYTVAEIAPLFEIALGVDNIILPEEFDDYL